MFNRMCSGNMVPEAPRIQPSSSALTTVEVSTSPLPVLLHINKDKKNQECEYSFTHVFQC